MKSLLLRMLVVSSLVVTALVATAAPALATDASCRDLGIGAHYWAGQHVNNTNRRINRVVAHIDVSSQTGAFSICQPTPLDFDDNGPSSWVSIEPSSVNTGCQDPGNCILQVGIIKCAAAGNGVCDGDGAVPSYFWAYGGCNGYQPTAKDLGPADYADHQYMVAEGSAYWYMYIDLVSRAKIAKTDPGISCWANGMTRVEYQNEKADSGDSVGTSQGPEKVVFDRMQYRYDDTTNYTNYTAGVGTCNGIVSDGRDYCNFPYPNQYRMDAWTAQ